MAMRGLIMPWSFLILFMMPTSKGCACPEATILTQFPLNVTADTCCLNFSGSTFGRVPWAVFSSHRKLQILDLSNCNISHIDNIMEDNTSFLLRKLYLEQNRLVSIPEDFLANANGLQVLNLGINLLESLPEGFMQNSGRLQVLVLRGNRLSSLPASVLKPSLHHLDLSSNPWACTCSLLEQLHGGHHDNTSSLEQLVGNLTCASPQSLRGHTVWSVQIREVCHQTELTALFILLPLLLLLGLVLCWCCGRKRKRKEVSSPGLSHKKMTHTNQNGHVLCPTKLAAGTPAGLGQSQKDIVLRNQMMLRPSTALLGSTRDIYEEVEIKLGSIDTLPRPPSSAASIDDSIAKLDSQGLGSRQDLETVSVTEVMKDSADREKAYLVQSTEYYSLVPGIEIEDSDHGEYESVDLS